MRLRATIAAVLPWVCGLSLIGCGSDGEAPADPDPPCDTSAWYPDLDGDGWGDARSPLFSCQPLLGYVEQAGDCDDAEPGVHPGADEACDGLDNDCDGEVDESTAPQTCYVDGDGDGYGDAGTSMPYLCEPPPGCVGDGTDCDDTDPEVHPGAAETWCDGLDSDCDGAGIEVRAVVDDVEYGSIQIAVDDSADGDTVRICPGTHLERIEVPDHAELALASFSGDAADTVLDGEVLDQILFAGAGSVVTVSQLTFRNGAAIANHNETGLWARGGAILSCGEALVVEGCVFEDNVCWTQGGAVEVRNDPGHDCGSAGQDLATLTVIDSVFTDNLVSDGHGGAIGMELECAGWLSISGSEFQSNRAWSQAAAIHVEGGDGTEVTIRDSLFQANEANSRGAVGLESEGFLTVLLSETSLLDNVGGGLWIDALGTVELTLERTVFDGNEQEDDGGAISLYGDGDAVLTIADSSFTDHASTYEGGAVYVGLDGSLELVATDTDFLLNSAEYDGGALFCDAASAWVTLEGCELSDNTSGNDGGAVSVQAPAGELLMTDCDLVGNTADHYGGGIHFEVPLLDLDHVRLVDNQAAASSGAIRPDSDDVLAELFLTDCTVNGSTSGGVYLWDDSVLYSVDTDWGSGSTDNDPWDIHTGEFEYADFTTGESFICESSGFCY